MYKAFAENREFTTEDVLHSIGARKPSPVGLIPHFYSNLSDLGFWGWRNSKVAWELPLNPANREITKNFIQCIHDKGIVKAMEKENEEDENEGHGIGKDHPSPPMGPPAGSPFVVKVLRKSLPAFKSVTIAVEGPYRRESL